MRAFSSRKVPRSSQPSFFFPNFNNCFSPLPPIPAPPRRPETNAAFPLPFPKFDFPPPDPGESADVFFLPLPRHWIALFDRAFPRPLLTRRRLVRFDDVRLSWGFPFTLQGFARSGGCCPLFPFRLEAGSFSGLPLVPAVGGRPAGFVLVLFPRYSSVGCGILLVFFWSPKCFPFSFFFSSRSFSFFGAFRALCPSPSTPSPRADSADAETAFANPPSFLW